MTKDSDEDLFWSPVDPLSSQTVLFRQRINTKYSLSLSTYEQLWRWSCDNRTAFWSELWEWESILGEKGNEPYLDQSASPALNPPWFPGATLNWAENQMRHGIQFPDDIAIIHTSEACSGWNPPTLRYTHRDLRLSVGKVHRYLKEAGVVKGDRVAFWGGNCAEAVIVLLATSSLGAIFSSAAADFGLDGVKERLEQIRPKVLFVTNAVVYAAQPRPLIPLLKPLLAGLSSPPAQTIIISHVREAICPTSIDYISATRVTKWEKVVDASAGDVELDFAPLGFNDPIWILFSSGTTGECKVAYALLKIAERKVGKPKAIVHRQGGMLLDSLREHHLAGDMSRGDVYFYYTTPGWMMFQYLVSGLATGATIVLYEGSPLKDPSSLWRMIDDLGITIFGTSAKWIEQISKHYPDVGKNHSLHTLKQILSTGSPLPPQLFDFVYEKVKKDVLLGSVTGGTDICSVFAGRNTSLPVYRGEIQSRMLGFDLDVSATESGLPGELICHKAFPIEPLGFWPLEGYAFPADEVAKALERFQESYFKGNEGTWYHGDYVQITPSRSGNGGGILMLGRSDGVLNPGGIRFGPTDIYSVLENDEFASLGVEETLVVGLMADGGADEKVVLFVKMRSGRELDETVMKKIKTSIRLARSARHVPSKILQVSDIPVTLTGKRVEVPIRKIINGAPATSVNPATLRNPKCLEEYVRLGERLRREEGM